MKCALRTCVLVVVAAGCEAQTKEASSTQPAVSRSVSLKEKVQPPKAETPAFHLLKFNLEAPGTAPRSVFRYGPMDFAVKATQTSAVMESKSGSEFTIETGLALTAKSGTIKVVGLKASGDQAPNAGEYDRLIGGQRAAAQVSDRGILTKMGGAASADARRELATMLLRHLVPFPKEEIGIGARWRVKYAISRGGVFIARTTTYELKKRSADELVLEVVTGESAEPQPILSDGAVSGELYALKSETRGSVSISTAMPIARSAALENSSTFHARTPGGEEIFREATARIKLAASTARPEPK